MKIDAITTCVGEKYENFLSRSLPIWLDTCDRVVVVTDDDGCLGFADSFGDVSHLYIIRTDLFTRYGASFNKGAALAEGFGHINPADWVLNFDADVLPPADWRTQIVSNIGLEPGKLYGSSHRHREDGSVIPDADYPNIWGFFHLWNVADVHSFRRPPYDVSVGHCGNYDHTFMMQWPESERVDIWPLVMLCHQGEPRQSWFGRDPANNKKMRALFSLGLYDAWKLRAGHIKVPEPKRVTINSEGRTPYEIVWLLRKYTDPDPFKWSVTVK